MIAKVKGDFWVQKKKKVKGDLNLLLLLSWRFIFDLGFEQHIALCLIIKCSQSVS